MVPDVDGGLLAASTTEIVLILTVVGIFAVAWLASMILVAIDAMPMGRKIGWFAALTLLAPVAIPYYLYKRIRRFRQQGREGVDAESAVGA
jgi:hypothetical protein